MMFPNDDEVLADMQRTLYAFYKQADSREAYQRLCEAKAEEKGGRPELKKLWIDFALQVYDEMVKENVPGNGA